MPPAVVTIAQRDGLGAVTVPKCGKTGATRCGSGIDNAGGAFIPDDSAEVGSDRVSRTILIFGEILGPEARDLCSFITEYANKAQKSDTAICLDSIKGKPCLDARMLSLCCVVQKESVRKIMLRTHIFISI